jgi:hypothetical protein
MRKHLRNWFCAIACLALAACSLPRQTAPAPASPTNQPETAPSPLPPTPSPAPLYPNLTLTALTREESGEAPRYTLKTVTPLLAGSDDPRVAQFNAAVSAIVEKEARVFRENLSILPAQPISNGSTFESGYTLISPPGDVFSLNIGFYTYADGAAHPFSYTITFTYDLASGREVTLESLFQPGADYLGMLSTYCAAELAGRDIGFDMFSAGAAPTPENYRNWNITPDGLLISFDPYQVAAYAAGPQTVLVPYSVLQPLLAPEGILGKWK